MAYPTTNKPAPKKGGKKTKGAKKPKGGNPMAGAVKAAY